MILLKFIYNILIAVDQDLNTILLGHPDETLSSRLGRSKGKERYIWVVWARLAVNTLFWFDKDYSSDGTILSHCEKSVMPLEQQNFREVADYELWSWEK